VDAFIRAMMDDRAPLQERVAELEATLEAAVQVLKGKPATISVSPRTPAVPEKNEPSGALENNETSGAPEKNETPSALKEPDQEQDALIGSVLMSAHPASSRSKRVAYALVPLLIAAAVVLAVKYFRIPVLHGSAADGAAAMVGRAGAPANTPVTTPGEQSRVPAMTTSSGQPNSQSAALLSSTPAAPALAGGLTIFLTARERCWIRATLDGDRKLERELDAGEQATVQARNEVVLRVGNAGAISVMINGVAALPLGRPGEPVTTRITSDNYQRLLRAIPTASSLITRPEKSGPVSGAGPASTPAG
jgi:hypothetical protein